MMLELDDIVFFQAEDGIRYLVRSRGLGDVYKRQLLQDWQIQTKDGFDCKCLGNFIKDKGIFAQVISAPWHHELDGRQLGKLCAHGNGSVSYTHLTLPTSDLV